MPLLDDLNEQQRAAAAHPGGPMLILAGAGSGKTRVITYRVAHLLASGVAARDVVAVTFTNKAASEMRERVVQLLGASGGAPAREMPWMGTFHAFGLRLLRREVAATDLRPGFVVYDQDDSRALVKACERELGIDDRTHLPRRVAARISRLKGDGERRRALREDDPDPFARVVAKVLPLYEQKLVEANACDFDDLLVRPVKLLTENEEVRDRWQEWVRHLLVDEYQDTNPIQYRLIRLLSGRHRNVCAVGDEDQSIYRFRGAELGNILNFEADFPGTTTFRIERNYRSSGNILNAANAVVSRNVARKGKVLWTDAEAGEPIRLRRCFTDLDEADWIVREAGRRIDEVGASNVAVMYRTNAQSRLFEEAFSRARIPHVVVGGMRFYERREVRDVLAYLRLIANADDDLALWRIINVPARGIGKGAQEAVREHARTMGVSAWRGLVDGVTEGSLPARFEAKLDPFIESIEELRRRAVDATPEEVIRDVLETTAYFTELEKEGPDVARDRRANLDELVNAAVEHELRQPGSGLAGFLAEVALASDTDALGQGDRVHLLTLHAAKGLEFDVVFLAGLEEGLFPHASAAEDPDDVEEERRLCYVGMTRARRFLALSHADRRRVFGQERLQLASRFLSEVPEDLVEREGSVPSRTSWSSPAPSAGRAHAPSATAVASFFGQAAEGEDESQEADAGEPEYQLDDGRAEAEEPAGGGELRRGDLVRHGRYGVGTVLSLEGRGPQGKVTVYFAGRGRVKLVRKHARLERV